MSIERWRKADVRQMGQKDTDTDLNIWSCPQGNMLGHGGVVHILGSGMKETDADP